MKTVGQVMTHDVMTVAPTDGLQRAAQLMRDMNVGALPVCDGQRLVGMITDRDITIRATANGLAPDACKVGDVMSGDIAWCFQDQTVGEVQQLMADRQLRRIVVIERASMRMIGMVALADLATRQPAPMDAMLEDISRPYPPQRAPTGKAPDTH
jgi:CBS domain-containing protein